ncbi:GHKL domain-containing protein [Rhizobium leguminosarum]|uniref:sensor histidine kinase n=1 Tax=Rhizobium leguminosarum TaxID=384 RepID=UPI001C98569D|nr:ATP-binding protein [Rhizobium leguminosarum]MBY5705720.1 GHKL domain-containing protein [Rhizobium leguminosarum]
MFRTQAIRRPGSALEHDLVFGLAAMALAAVVFFIDTFTEIEGAIAVLYVIATLLAAQAVSQAGLIVCACIFVMLALISYGYTHFTDYDLQSTMRLLVALAALLVTTMLLLKTERARLSLLSLNAALKESEFRYRSIFDQTRVALWERDYSSLRSYLMELKAGGKGDVRKLARTNPGFVDECLSRITVVAANEAARELLGPQAASVGELRKSILSGHEKFLDLLQVIVDGGRVYEDKVEARADTGEEKLVLLSINFPKAAEAFDRVVVSMVDVTQRELALKTLAEAQAELARASKATAIGAMSASLAHELNQPLGAVLVNASTLLRWLDRDPPDIAAARRSTERIIRDAHRASEIIQNTRGLLSQTAGKLETVRIDDLIDETLALMEHELQRSVTSIVVEMASSVALPVVRIELQQVLINLITNAIQAMAESDADRRVITLTTDARDRDHLRIVVRDSGPGIDAKILKTLFTPFKTTKATGLGMGLSICRSTIEARGGRLNGYNDDRGGAVFEIHLPMTSELVDA